MYSWLIWMKKDEFVPHMYVMNLVLLLSPDNFSIVIFILFIYLFIFLFIYPFLFIHWQCWCLNSAYLVSHIHSPFSFSYFSGRVLHFCLRPTSDSCPPTYGLLCNWNCSMCQHTWLNGWDGSLTSFIFVFVFVLPGRLRL
jgi:hypothetical protein